MAGISRTRRGTPTSEGTNHRKGVRAGHKGRAGLIIATIIALITGTFAIGGPTASAAAPVAQGFTVSPADLAYILRQIRIAEAHVANTTPETGPCGALLGNGPDQIQSPALPEGLRTVDGTCNNLQPGQSTYGAASEIFPRLTTPTFRAADPVPPGFGPPAGSGVFGEEGSPTSYAQKKGLVFDAQPRDISNLIVDQTSTNPAALAASGHPVRSQDPSPSAVPCDPQTDPPTFPRTPEGCTPEHETLFIPNITTDVGLSPPFNSLFTIFGQFFDHGVDKIVNGGSGTVFVPLRDDDPLVAGDNHIFGDSDDIPPSLRFMTVTRSTNRPGPDGVTGDNPATPLVDESADDEHEALNVDTPFVDQSQTYTSHSSHQVFVREYVDNTAGNPVSTGKLLHSADGGMSTWGQVKAQAATVLGLQLTDADVGNIPMIAADAYGKFIPGPARGLPQYVTETGLVEGNRAAPVLAPANVKRISMAFLNDIAHSADPKSGNPDADLTAGESLDTPVCTFPATQCYDNELLDAHFIAGDGRVNENIALTSIHQVFHSEHDRLVDDMKNTIVANAAGPDPILQLSDWQTALGAPDVSGVWNGERLFQAARFVTEMEYQHLVFEEFARKVQPELAPFQPFALTQTDVNPAVVAEYAHAVYRFGHSMLTETIARTNEDGSHNDIPLFDAFLDPLEYTNGGTAGPLTSQEAAGSIIMGISDQTGNEIDEFVTDVLRNRLVGLPLDLPSINMARARAEGIPSLNNLRKQLHATTNDGQLAPYQSWTDFGLALKHPESLINFVAAYGTHPTITSATTLTGKRDAARAIVDPQLGDVMPLDAFEFMDSSGPWANSGSTSNTGLDQVDLWVGGLAENTNLFGGLLGSTFNYVFENQLLKLQNADRLYYLTRTPGMNLRAQLEGNSFAELIMRNTTAHSLKADPFATADCKFELSNLAGTAAGFASFGQTVADDPASECNETAVLIRRPDGQIRYRAINSEDPPGINGQSVYNGTSGVDRIYGGNDNDTFLGNEANDIIDGGGGDDIALGGEGNDIITDFGGNDVHKGGPGNDAIDGGAGLDILMGGDGNDFTNGGANDNETFGGAGDDFMIGGAGVEDAMFGDSGNDWIQGDIGTDLLIGDSSSFLFDDHNIPGHDVLIGGTGDDDYDMEGGDDIGVSGPGIEKNAGAGGWDWSINLWDPQPADADLDLPLVEVPLGVNGVRDRYNEVESLSGWKFDDKLRGDSVIPSQITGGGFIGCDALDQKGLDRIAGLDPLVPPLTVDSGPIKATAVTHFCLLTGNVWGEGNIILGGGGSDLMEGRGGDDILDGDHFMNVRISLRTNPANPATEIGSTDLMEHAAVTGNFGPGTAGMSLQQAVFAGLVDPGNLVPVREILTPPAPLPGSPEVDTAVFSDILANYTITSVGGPNRQLIVSHLAGTGADGTDIIYNTERLAFVDATVATGAFFDEPATGDIVISDSTPTEGDTLSFTSSIVDPDGFNPAEVAFTWQAETSPGTWTDVGTGDTFVPTNAEVGFPLRVVAVFTDNFGVLESVTGTETGPVANVNQPAEGAPALSTLDPEAGAAITADTSDITDPDGVVGVTFSFQFLADGNPIPGATNPSFTPGAAQVGQSISVLVSFTDNHGTAEQRTSAPTAPVIAAPTPIATISPLSVAFAPRVVGTTSPDQTISVTNTGSGTLVISSATLGGANSNQFGISNGCTTLGAGASCTIDVRFAPTTTGVKSASVSIVHNAAGSPTSVGLSGTATPAAPVASLSTSAIAFGNRATGTVSPNTAVTVTNTGTANLVVTGVTRTGTNANQFQHTNGCTTVVPGASCTVNVRFAPTTVGAKTATLNIANNAPGSPHTVTLTGTGTAPVPVLAMPATLGFGTRRINTTTTRTFRLRNNGPGPLTIISLNASTARFTVNRGTCPGAAATLAAGASCDLNVNFLPNAVANFTGVLTVTSNASNSPTTATLTGTGRN